MLALCREYPRRTMVNMIVLLECVVMLATDSCVSSLYKS